MSLLEVKNVTKIYGKNNNAFKALDDVSINIEDGEFIAVTGASGSGKSTLLHILGGVDQPNSGSVTIDGENINTLNDSKLSEFRRKNIGLIYQFYNLIPVLNVKENIQLPVLLGNDKVDIDRFNELVNILGLSEKLNNFPNQLSGGQQQRVAIGRALMMSPKLILADEPTGNLDSRNSKEILKLLIKCNRKYNQTIILITHDMKIAKIADRQIKISDGKIIFDSLTEV